MVSTNEKQPVAQLSAGGALREIISNPKMACIVAVGLFVLGLFLPVVNIVDVQVKAMAFTATSIALVGNFVWFVLAALVAAAASRFVASLARFRFLLDLAVLACWGIGVYLGLTLTGLPELARVMLETKSYSPAIGALPLVLSLLFSLRALQLSRKQGYATS